MLTEQPKKNVHVPIDSYLLNTSKLLVESEVLVANLTKSYF